MSERIIDFNKAQIYQKDHLVLKDVSFTVDKGEFVFIIGPTGSGKSSILKTIYGDLPFEKGHAYALDYDLSKLKSKEIPYLRRRLGAVFQDFQLLTDRSVFENLAFVLKATGWKDKKKIQQRCEKVLENVGMATKAFKMPYALSGGEQQRVGIARALLNDPELILADEPTGNLDPDTSKGIMKLLENISKNGRAVIMASHDYMLMNQFPNRTLRCEQGTLIDTKQKAVSNF